MLYRFKCGHFVKGRTFKEAKDRFLKELEEELEEEKRWHKCSCLGLSHRDSCPENPVNKGEIPF